MSPLENRDGLGQAPHRGDWDVAARARGLRERRMASRVPLLRSGRGERAIADRLPWPEPPLRDWGSREARPRERRRTGEPSPARQQPLRRAAIVVNEGQ
jgi:hypothetical protein